MTLSNNRKKNTEIYKIYQNESYNSFFIKNILFIKNKIVMSFIINIILLILSVIVLGVSGGFATNSAVRLTGVTGYDDNEDLKNGHKYLSIAAIICWITVALLIILTVLFIVFTPEEAEAGAVTGLSFKDYFVYGLLFITLATVLVIGILSAIGSNYIRISGVEDNNLAYRQAIIATVLSIICFTILLIGLILKFTYKPKKKEEPIDKDITMLKTELSDL
jgi:hypothetical protein